MTYDFAIGIVNGGVGAGVREETGKEPVVEVRRWRGRGSWEAVIVVRRRGEDIVLVDGGGEEVVGVEEVERAARGAELSVAEVAEKGGRGIGFVTAGCEKHRQRRRS